MKKYYISCSASRTVLGEKTSEFKVSKLFSVDFYGNDEYVVLHYTLFHQIVEGNAIIHNWIDKMDEFQNKLILKYDFKSQTISLENYEVLKNKWESSFKNDLINNFKIEGVETMIEHTEKLLYDKKEYEKQFNGYSIFRCFFNPAYENDLSDKEIDLVNYLGVSDLNIITSAEIIEDNSLLITARINESKTDISKTIRELTHSINIKPNLEVDMEEKYQVDNNNLPVKVDLYLDTSIIPNFYNITNGHQLLAIDESDFHEIGEKFKNDNLTESPFVIN